MPFRDQTGPAGEGPQTGLGLGPCTETPTTGEPLVDIQQVIESPMDDEILYSLDRVDDYLEDTVRGPKSLTDISDSDFDAVATEQALLMDAQTYVWKLKDLIADYLLGVSEAERREIIDELFSTLQESDAEGIPARMAVPTDETSVFMSAVYHYGELSQYQLDNIDRTTRSLSDIVGGLSMTEAAGIMAIVNMLKNWTTNQRQQLAQDIAWELNRGNLPAGQDVLRYRSPY